MNFQFLLLLCNEQVFPWQTLFLVSGHGAGLMCDSVHEPAQREQQNEDENKNAEDAARKQIKQNQNKEIAEVKTKDKRKSRK